MNSLTLVKKYFPAVKSVVDAIADVDIQVTKRDLTSAKVKNHEACAMAVAAKRLTGADGVIVSLTKAYIIRGNQAIRFNLPESISREIVSFDREAGFDPGEYRLLKVKSSITLGRAHTSNEGKPSKKKIKKHKTGNVRCSLASL